MVRFLVRRIALGLLVMLMVTILVFAIFFLSGNAQTVARRLAGRNASQQTIGLITQRLHLNRPVIEQYWEFLKQLVWHHNLGYSYYHSQPVSTVIKQAIPITLSLAIGASILWLVLGIGSGVLSAVRRGSVLDRMVTIIALFFYSMPTFVLGLLLLYLVYYQLAKRGIHVFPGQGYTPLTQNPVKWFESLVLPWITLALVYAATYTRLTRGSLLEVLGEDYIRTARSKGLTERRVIFRHGLRSAPHPCGEPVRHRYRHAGGRSDHHRGGVRPARARLHRSSGHKQPGPPGHNRDCPGGERRCRCSEHPGGHRVRSTRSEGAAPLALALPAGFAPAAGLVAVAGMPSACTRALGNGQKPPRPGSPPAARPMVLDGGRERRPRHQPSAATGNLLFRGCQRSPDQAWPSLFEIDPSCVPALSTSLVVSATRTSQSPQNGPPTDQSIELPGRTGHRWRDRTSSQLACRVRGVPTKDVSGRAYTPADTGGGRSSRWPSLPSLPSRSVSASIVFSSPYPDWTSLVPRISCWRTRPDCGVRLRFHRPSRGSGIPWSVRRGSFGAQAGPLPAGRSPPFCRAIGNRSTRLDSRSGIRFGFGLPLVADRFVVLGETRRRRRPHTIGIWRLPHLGLALRRTVDQTTPWRRPPPRRSPRGGTPPVWR